MARLTRSESQAQTRARLIQTAKDLFLDTGYLATSLEKVAETAGYSKGAVYSNFANKDELCMAVLDDIRIQRVAELTQIATHQEIEAALEQLQEWAERVIGDTSWTPLELELAVQSRRNADLRAQLAARLDGIFEVLGVAIDQVDDVDTPMPGRELAVALLALGVGLGLFRMIDPSIPVSGLIETFRALAGQSINNATPNRASRP